MFLFPVFRGIKREHSPGISSGGTSHILDICYILSLGQFSFKIEVLFLQMPTNADSKKKNIQILFLYGRTRLSDNPYCRIFCAEGRSRM